MPNLRLVYDNVLERPGATLTGTNVAGPFAASNLLKSKKSSVYRTVGTLARMTVALLAAEAIGAVLLPICNLSAAATMRTRVSTEQPMTNLLINSHLASSWGGTGCVKTNNSVAVLAPDGTNTAGLVLQDTGNSAHYIDRTIAPLSGNFVNGEVYTSSMFVKANGSTVLRLSNYYAVGGATGRTAQFDLATGTVTSKGLNESAAIQALPNGWFRISVTNTIDTAATEPVRLLTRVLIGTAAAFLGDGVSGFYLWGGQTEKGVLTSFYPSGAAFSTRPIGYIDSWQSYNYDITSSPCLVGATKIRGMTAAQAASAYAYGGGSCAVAWLPVQLNATGIDVIINDPGNAQGYIECSYLVVGPVWSPARNAAYGAGITPITLSKKERDGAMNLRGERGPRAEKLSFDLKNMSDADRNKFWQIVQYNGTDYPIFASIMPESTDLVAEQMFSLYGCLSQLVKLMLQSFGTTQTSVELDSM